jgi:hypothetical protein
LGGGTAAGLVRYLRLLHHELLLQHHQLNAVDIDSLRRRNRLRLYDVTLFMPSQSESFEQRLRSPWLRVTPVTLVVTILTVSSLILRVDLLMKAMG